jgi:carbamoylphosphate synthase large subunit
METIGVHGQSDVQAVVDDKEFFPLVAEVGQRVSQAIKVGGGQAFLP